MKIFLLLSIFILVIIGIPASFAQTDNITVKHWFITSYESGCSVGNQQSLEFYEKLTPQYLSKYDIHGTQDLGKCVTGIDVANNIDQFTNTITQYDLPIIILDGFKGLDYALTTDALGHWQWQNQQNVIVFASLSPFIESDTGAWILGHELSHFALHHKQYPSSIFGEWVHETESSARSCLGDDLSINDCPELWTTVQAPSSKNIKMMKIYTDSSVSTNSETTSSSISDTQPIQFSQDLSELSVQCFTLGSKKQFQEAIQACEQLLKNSSPNDIYYDSALLYLAQNHEKLGNYDLAIAYEEERLERNPNDFLILTSLCYTHLSAGKYGAGYDYGNRALAIDDDILPRLCIQGIERKLSSNPPTYDVKPVMSNGYISSMSLDHSKNSLILKVVTEGSKDGYLQIVLPRELIDKRFVYPDLPITDQDFYVDFDGVRKQIEEVSITDTERVLRIPVSADTKTITIEGNESIYTAKVIPEFSIMVLPILTISILLIVVMSRKYSVHLKF